MNLSDARADTITVLLQLKHVEQEQEPNQQTDCTVREYTVSTTLY